MGLECFEGDGLEPGYGPNTRVSIRVIVIDDGLEELFTQLFYATGLEAAELGDGIGLALVEAAH